MFNINVSRQLNASIEDVFTMLADHGSYARFKGIDAASVLEPGEKDHNGLGALREITSAAGVLRERIVEYQYPHTLGYLIEYSKPLPYRHEHGLIKLTANEKGTLANWQSRGTIAIPILGTFYFDKKIETGGSRAFASILKQIDNMLMEHAEK